MVSKSKPYIKEKFEKIKSAHTFYYFYSKLFEHIKNEANLHRIVDFV